MARIETAAEVLDDLERFFEHLTACEVEDVVGRLGDIVQAVDVLATSPLIGQPVEGSKRELVIGRESRGCIALYLYVAEADTVFLLAVRNQFEVGYGRDG